MRQFRTTLTLRIQTGQALFASCGALKELGHLYFLVVLFLFVDMAHFCTWTIFVTVLAVAFMFCCTSFLAFAKTLIIFAWCFPKFTHNKHNLPIICTADAGGVDAFHGRFERGQGKIAFYVFPFHNSSGAVWRRAVPLCISKTCAKNNAVSHIDGNNGFIPQPMSIPTTFGIILSPTVIVSPMVQTFPG